MWCAEHGEFLYWAQCADWLYESIPAVRVCPCSYGCHFNQMPFDPWFEQGVSFLGWSTDNQIPTILLFMADIPKDLFFDVIFAYHWARILEHSYQFCLPSPVCQLYWWNLVLKCDNTHLPSSWSACMHLHFFCSLFRMSLYSFYKLFAWKMAECSADVTFLSYHRFRLAWIAFNGLLDFGGKRNENFICSACGESPDIIICDGTTLSFEKRYLLVRHHPSLKENLIHGSRYIP